MRGDWKMFAEILKIPQWNEKAGCCFKCNVKVDEIRNFHSDADWRKPENRMDHWAFVRRLSTNRQPVSNLFRCPGFSTECIAIDWLHCCDQGVCCDFLGILFFMLLQYQEGCANKARVSSLFKKIQAYYAANNADNRLDNLTELMLRKKGTASPKPRASAAEARGLVRFAAQEAEASLDSSDPIQEAAKQAAAHLLSCYEQLSHSTYNQKQLEKESIAFCMLYSALEKNAEAQGLNLWRVKPNFHAFQELCMSPGNPSDQWTYRDEDFGGYLAAVSRRRGGKNTVSSTCKNVLLRFMAKFEPLLRN